jgi:hypothetical protein
MLVTFKSAATMLALCLLLQADADTLLDKVIHAADGDTLIVFTRRFKSRPSA